MGNKQKKAEQKQTQTQKHKQKQKKKHKPTPTEIIIKSIEPQKEKFKTLFDLGCCFLCCYRIVGIVPPYQALSLFKDSKKAIYRKIFGKPTNVKPTTKPNPYCLACLSILKTENFEQILKVIYQKQGYQNVDFFGINITVPPSIILRESCLCLFVSLPLDNIIPLKQILKETVFERSKLESLLGAPQGLIDQASLSIKIGWKYPYDKKEISQIKSLLPSSNRKRKKQSYKTKLKLKTKEKKVLQQQLFEQKEQEKKKQKQKQKENEKEKEKEIEKEIENENENEKEMEIENEKIEKQRELEDKFLVKYDPEAQIITSKSVKNSLKNITKDELEELCPIPPEPVKEQTSVIIYFTSKPIYIFGKYCKMSRNIPNAPWYIGDERKGNYSVEEFVSRPLTNIFSGTHSGFVSSGREDIDVRMLGTGRPFILEIYEPKIYKQMLSLKEKKQIVEQVFNISEGLVTIKDLKVVGKSYRKKTIEGENKRKGYRCVVWCKCSFDQQLFTQKLHGLTSDTNGELILKQKTPVRVLHRRNLAVRERTIYEIKNIKQINQNFLIMDLITQGGTYVKEFINGDFGRTNPNFAQIIGCKSELVQLDVISVNLNK
ncbi:tRNA pseudouridine synthase pus10-related [Anaeramoeba flamelloides]|uniref:tRNA pseudouridine(55) synthase n=1 Tax=Anaeramoeba flamelloides TaxID=1746091 RepID=A0AAV7ZQ16_9EUKA|nr:tRNA pseudouridine synthase pus10-related [Anaeramoeba flamelloides]